MSDCQHEWADVSIDLSGDQFVFSCLHCGKRLEAGPLTSAVIKAEQQLGLPEETMPLEHAGVGPENHRSVAWSYESTYYHIYAQTSLLDGVLDPVIIEIPRSERDDVDVQSVVDALNRMVSRMDPGTGLPPSPRAWFNPRHDLTGHENVAFQSPPRSAQEVPSKEGPPFEGKVEAKCKHSNRANDKK